MESVRCIHCHTAILSVHYEQLDAVDLMAVAQEFVKRYPSRERIFGKFLLSVDFLANTVRNTDIGTIRPLSFVSSLLDGDIYA